MYICIYTTMHCAPCMENVMRRFKQPKILMVKYFMFSLFRSSTIFSDYFFFFFAFSQFSVHFIQFANCNGHLNAYLSSVSRLSASRHLCVWFLVVSPILYAPHLYAHSMCDELGRRMLPRSYVYSHNRIWTRKNSTTTSACAKNSEPAADWVVIVEGFYLCSVANDVASLIHVYPTNMKTNTQRSFEWKKKKKKKKEGATTKDAFLRHWVFTAMWFGKRTQRMLWG